MMPLNQNPRYLIAACAASLLAGAIVLSAETATAQIATPISVSSTDSTAKLRDRLVNRLRATTEPQQKYIESITKLVTEHQLELRLVVAVERYAIRRNPHYPFPFFERALKFEAQKRGVNLPSIQHFRDLSRFPPQG